MHSIGGNNRLAIMSDPKSLTEQCGSCGWVSDAIFRGSVLLAQVYSFWCLKFPLFLTLNMHFSTHFLGAVSPILAASHFLRVIAEAGVDSDEPPENTVRTANEQLSIGAILLHTAYRKLACSRQASISFVPSNYAYLLAPIFGYKSAAKCAGSASVRVTFSLVDLAAHKPHKNLAAYLVLRPQDQAGKITIFGIPSFFWRTIGHQIASKDFVFLLSQNKLSSIRT